MDMYELKFTKLQNEIFRLLCIKVGEKLNKRTIANLLKVSPTAVSKSLIQLEKEGLVKIEKAEKMNLTLINLNREDKKAINFKRVENLKMLYESGFIENLEEKFPASTIILFGSYAYGDDTIKSDLDIAIIGYKDKKINLDSFEKVLEREIRINFYENFSKIHKHLKENLCNGIIFKGGVEL